MNGEKVVKQYQRNLNERSLSPHHGYVDAAPCKHHGAEQKHDELSGNRDEKTDDRQDDDGNGCLREHGCDIRDRKRLPEQNAAIVALSV